MVTIEVPSKRKEGPCELKEVSIAEIWQKSPDRQTYSYLTFDQKNKVNPDCLNTYLGFTHCEYLAHEQYDDGLLNEYLDLILRLANNDHAVYAYVVKWMASIVQFPWRKTRTSIVFKGGQGTGKGTVLTGFKAVCGSMGLYAKSASHIFSQFDSHFQGKLFCFADEALFSGSKKDQDLFKSMITQKHTSFQAKGRDIVTGVDYVNFGLASNSEWTVDVDSDDRRFLIVKTSSDSGLVNEGHKDKSSAEYLALMAMFKRLNEAFDDGILHKHLYRYLLEMDLTGFETNVIPYTDAKIDEKLYSASSAIKFIHEVLSEGVVSQLFANPAGGKVPSKILNEEFQAWINENNVRHHNNRVEIKSLVNILKLESYRTNDARGYILPTKILAKQYLCEYFKDWEYVLFPEVKTHLDGIAAMAIYDDIEKID